MLILLLILLLSACTGAETTIQIHNDTEADARKIEEVILANPKLLQAVAVFHNQDLISGLNLKTFSRFNKEKIEKDIRSALEDKYPELDVTVSADLKIFRETTKLLEEDDKEKLTKQLEKLKKLLREET